MHEFAVLNFRIVPTKGTKIKAISPSAFYGKSIFTTVAIYDSQPFLLEKHWRRITANAGKIGINLSEFSEAKVKNSLFEIIRKNKISDARARITFFDESSISIWQAEQKLETSFLINTADLRAVSESFRLTISPFPINSTSPVSGVKSGNYLEHILALENAKAIDFDEAARVNERGEIVSACLANLFWLKGGELFTPQLTTGCLAGTTREFVLENYAVNEVKANLSELDEAETIFLTSSGVGIVQATEFQKRKLSRETHELTKIIRRLISE